MKFYSFILKKIFYI